MYFLRGRDSVPTGGDSPQTRFSRVDTVEFRSRQCKSGREKKIRGPTCPFFPISLKDRPRTLTNLFLEETRMSLRFLRGRHFFYFSFLFLILPLVLALLLSGCGVSKEELGKEPEKESTEPVKSAEPEEYRI